jgi:hypothetical protein
MCSESRAVDRAQLPAGVAEHFHPPPPRLLPKMIRRQNPARQPPETISLDLESKSR